MALRLLELIAGLAVAAIALMDVFDTVVAPGSSRAWLRVAERLRRLSLPVWRRSSHLAGEPPRIARAFASFILLTTFASWMLILWLGFGLAHFALGNFFQPRITTFSQALYAAGGALVTLGLSGEDAHGLGRWIVLITGFCGMAVITLAITYIIQLQNALQQRDEVVVRLGAVAGRPPSGITLLETYGRLGCQNELGPLFRDWSRWTGAVLHSQTAHPAVAYFQSLGSDTDWPAALGVMLDAASIVVAFVDDASASGPAMLLHRDGARLAAVMARLLGVDASLPSESTAEAADQLRERLQAAGYRISPEAGAQQRLAALRGHYQPRLIAMADHLGADGLKLNARRPQ